MAYIFDLPQTIGVDAGETHDGAILGTFSRKDYNGISFYSQYHEFQYAVINGSLTDPDQQEWIEVQDAFNSGTAQDLFTPGVDPNYNFKTLYISYRDGIDGYRFNCTTEATGTFTFVVEYNSPTGYITLPGAVLSANFLQELGDGNTLTLGTIPTNWQEDYIGIPNIPRQKWLRIRVATGTVTGPATITGAWAKSAVPEDDITPGAANPPFYNPYGNRLITEGDILYFSSQYKNGLMNFAYTTPLVGDLSYLYSKVDGTFGVLEIQSDLSSNWNYANNLTVDATNLVAAGAGATISSVEGLYGNCYVEAECAATPTATTNQWLLGLSNAQTGTIKYGLFMTFVAGTPRYQVIIDGSLVFTTPADFGFYNDVQIWRYNGIVYFFAGGKSFGSVVEVPDNDLLYVRVVGTDNAVEINNVNFVDWSSSRYAKPIALTWTENTDFDPPAPSTITKDYPAMYSIAFNTPDDFAPLTAELSKTGVAGYNIGIVNMTTPTQDPVLMLENYIGCDDPDNTLFKTGTQTIINFSNLITQNTDEGAYIDPIYRGAFTYIIKNSVGGHARVAMFFDNSAERNNICVAPIVPKIGVTDIGIIQVGFQKEDQLVGNPSEISIST
jgi:hypothetical protein